MPQDERPRDQVPEEEIRDDGSDHRREGRPPVKPVRQEDGPDEDAAHHHVERAVERLLDLEAVRVEAQIGGGDDGGDEQERGEHQADPEPEAPVDLPLGKHVAEGQEPGEDDNPEYQGRVVLGGLLDEDEGRDPHVHGEEARQDEEQPIGDDGHAP